MDHSLICSWYEKYKNGIFRYALTLTRDIHFAEDVLQETFAKLLSTKHPCADGKEQAWLYRVARNLCYDQLRKATRESSGDISSAVATPQYAYIEMLSSLSTADQEIVTLKIVGGLSHREIGVVLGISEKAAQKRYERAIAALRKEAQ